MTVFDLILQLLYQGPMLEKEICRLLGREWDELQETIGLMRLQEIIEFNHIKDSTKSPLWQKNYYLTQIGRREFQKRRADAWDK